MKLTYRATLTLAAVLVLVVAACSSAAEGPTIETGDSPWSAVPLTLESGGGSFSITAANSGTEQQEFVVVSLFGGDPEALPMHNGLLDLSRDGLFTDSEDPDVATFQVVHPEYERREGEGVEPGVVVPDTVDPGEEKSVTIGGFKGGGEPGTYVVLSYKPGRYEAGDYAAFTVTDPDS